MKKNIDILIINNCPSFYKINLYNELAKYVKIHVVFVGLTNQVVINTDYKKDILFSYELLSEIQIEKRNKLFSICKLIRILRQYNYIKLIYGGYNDIEERFLIWFTPKSKNCLQFESSIKESKVSGILAIIKKMIFSRFSIVLPSGKLQSDVFKALQYKGKIIETKGVGLFSKPSFSKNSIIRTDLDLKYLYVGRLIALKNLKLLIEVFNRSGKSLTIVGTGILEAELKVIAHSNIKFSGFVPNNEIANIYLSHDVFVLPSFSETWGLVVEEAIYYGLPVLVSDAVGSQYDMVIKPKTGVVFSPFSDESLENSILQIEKGYNFYKGNCLNFDSTERDKEQVQVYLNLLSL